MPRHHGDRAAVRAGIQRTTCTGAPRPASTLASGSYCCQRSVGAAHAGHVPVVRRGLVARAEERDAPVVAHDEPPPFLERLLDDGRSLERVRHDERGAARAAAREDDVFRRPRRRRRSRRAGACPPRPPRSPPVTSSTRTMSPLATTSAAPSPKGAPSADGAAQRRLVFAPGRAAWAAAEARDAAAGSAVVLGDPFPRASPVRTARPGSRSRARPRRRGSRVDEERRAGERSLRDTSTQCAPASPETSSAPPSTSAAARPSSSAATSRSPGGAIGSRLPVTRSIIQRSPVSARTSVAAGPNDTWITSDGRATTGRSSPSKVSLAYSALRVRNRNPPPRRAGTRQPD